MRVAYMSRFLLSAVVVTALAACGGGGGGGDSTSTDTAATSSVVSSGVVTGFGSLIVHGVHFDESDADVWINDYPGSGDHKGLKIGMAVKIKGHIDGSKGVATHIDAEHEVKGKIASIDSDKQEFVVNSQTIRASARTVYDDVHGFNGLVPGMFVEVYGLRDADEIIHATLIEAEDSDFSEEVRGKVSGLTSDTFKIGDLLICYDDTTPVEHGTLDVDLKEGAFVEVNFDSSGGMPYCATKIEFEDKEDSKFYPHEGDQAEIEGYVSEYDYLGDDTFKVGSYLVKTTSKTMYEGKGDLSNGIWVEAKGYISEDHLVAKEISYGNYCNGEIYDGYYDNLYVAKDATCTLNGTKVDGSVYVEEYGALIVKKSMDNNAYIAGNIQGYRPKYVQVMEMTHVGGNFQIEKAMGPSSLKNSYIKGNVQVEHSYIADDVSYAWDISMNYVGGDVQFNYNKADYGMFWIYGNEIGGNLQCEENYPSPTGGDNLVYGNAEGQCYDLAKKPM